MQFSIRINYYYFNRLINHGTFCRIVSAARCCEFKPVESKQNLIFLNTNHIITDLEDMQFIRDGEKWEQKIYCFEINQFFLFGQVCKKLYTDDET